MNSILLASGHPDPVLKRWTNIQHMLWEGQQFGAINFIYFPSKMDEKSKSSYGFVKHELRKGKLGGPNVQTKSAK